MKYLNYKLYYQQLHLKYLCSLARYWLQAPWGWHDSAETCRNMIICEIIVHLLVIIWRSVDRASWKILIIKPTRCTNFSHVFFGIKRYMFRTVPLSIIRSFSLYTRQWYTSYWLLCVQWKTPDDIQWNCPKQVEFYFKNKFEKLVHLVSFIVRIVGHSKK